MPKQGEADLVGKLRRFAMRAPPGDNLEMKSGRLDRSPGARGDAPFSAGALVIVTLGNPREKFWGMVLTLAQEGLSLSGAELSSVEDLAAMVRDGEPFIPSVIFFPMHRIERVELDLPRRSLPSLSQRFLAKTGLEPATALVPKATGEGAPGAGKSRRSASKERAQKERA